MEGLCIEADSQVAVTSGSWMTFVNVIYYFVGVFDICFTLYHLFATEQFWLRYLHYNFKTVVEFFEC
jgi:hypothetical protein